MAGAFKDWIRTETDIRQAIMEVLRDNPDLTESDLHISEFGVVTIKDAAVERLQAQFPERYIHAIKKPDVVVIQQPAAAPAPAPVAAPVQPEPVVQPAKTPVKK